MTDNSDIKKAMAFKIKALLAKTTEAGCSEAEALAAAHKAHELLAKYQLSLSDLDLREEGTEQMSVNIDANVRDLAVAVGKYCECKVWEGQGKMHFLGIKSDAFFAEWLMLALSSFVARKTLDYSLSQITVFQRDVQDFSIGCSQRISQRLLDEVALRAADVVTGRELTIVKGQLITEAWAKKNITLRSANWRRSASASEAYSAGVAAGNAARFNRPVARDEFETRAIAHKK